MTTDRALLTKVVKDAALFDAFAEGFLCEVEKQANVLGTLAQGTNNLAGVISGSSPFNAEGASLSEAIGQAIPSAALTGILAGGASALDRKQKKHWLRNALLGALAGGLGGGMAAGRSAHARYTDPALAGADGKNILLGIKNLGLVTADPAQAGK